MALLRTFFISTLLWLPFQAPAETLLLMAEEDGCVWCARWNAEIAPVYPKTDEGRAAPLVRFDMHDDAPDGIELASKIRFSPTFVLVRDGQEVDRLEGYPGEDFFWGVLGVMLERSSVHIDETG